MSFAINTKDGVEPCPFCGTLKLSVIGYQQRGLHFLVMCGECRCRGPLAYERAEAIRKWNRKERPRAEVIQLHRVLADPRILPATKQLVADSAVDFVADVDK